MTITEIIREVMNSAKDAYRGALFAKDFGECMACSDAYCDSECALKKKSTTESSK